MSSPNLSPLAQLISRNMSPWFLGLVILEERLDEVIFMSPDAFRLESKSFMFLSILVMLSLF